MQQIIYSAWPVSCCYSFVSSVENLNSISSVEVEPLPRAVLQAFSSQFAKSDSRAAEINEADLSGIDITLTRSLMPFQQHGVKYVPYTSCHLNITHITIKKHYYYLFFLQLCGVQRRPPALGWWHGLGENSAGHLYCSLLQKRVATADSYSIFRTLHLGWGNLRLTLKWP